MALSATIVDNGIVITVMPITRETFMIRLHDLEDRANDAISRELTESEVHRLLAYYHTIGTSDVTLQQQELWEEVFPVEDWRNIGQ